MISQQGMLNQARQTVSTSLRRCALSRWMKKIMKKKLLLIIACVIAISFFIWEWDRYQDQQIKVTVDSTTPLYASEVDAAYGSHKPVGTLKTGDKLKVNRATYGKDYGALLVETDGGTRGWVAFGQKWLTIHRQK